MGRAGAREAEARDAQSADRVEPDVIAGRDDLDDDRRRALWPPTGAFRRLGIGELPVVTVDLGDVLDHEVVLHDGDLVVGVRTK